MGLDEREKFDAEWHGKFIELTRNVEEPQLNTPNIRKRVNRIDARQSAHYTLDELQTDLAGLRADIDAQLMVWDPC